MSEIPFSLTREGMSRLMPRAALPIDAVLPDLLDGYPIIASEGRLHPVEIRYQPRHEQQPWPAAIAGAAAGLLSQTAGDLLAFLPGLQEIRRTVHELAPA